MGGLQFFGRVRPNFRGGFPPNLGGFSSKFLGGSLNFWGRGSPPEYGQHSAGTHPTGMHSCLFLFLLPANEVEER